MPVSQNSTSNILLKTMDANDFADLAKHFVRVALPVGLQLHTAGSVGEYVYFLEDGIASVMMATSDGRPCEIGLIGREGLSETATLLGLDIMPYDVHMLVTGASGLRLPNLVLLLAFENSTTLRRLLLGYVQCLMTQSATSLAAAHLTVEQRLARLILMFDDRLDGRAMPITHELIAIMLKVRRPGVTVAIEKLVRQELVAKRRGVLTVRDRRGLTELSCGSYGVAEATFDRILKLSNS